MEAGGEAAGEAAGELVEARGQPLNVSCAWGELGWPADARVSVRDVWARRELGVYVGGYTAANVPPRDVRLLRLTLL